MNTSPFQLRLRPAALVAVLLAVLATACADQPATPSGESAARDDAGEYNYPEWVEKVYPPPGSNTSVDQTLQVNHSAVAQDQQVRLTLDGTDVTAYANETSPGLLEYDLDQEATPVPLKPGEHTAVIELFQVTPGASEGVESYDEDVHQAIDRFEWTFTVL